MSDRSRRQVLREGLIGMGVVMTSPVWVSGCRNSAGPELSPYIASNIPELGPLNPPDENGVMLPQGFTSRIVARTNEMPVTGSEYQWHVFPDGGATFATEDGGWIYVSNSEFGPLGGVGALRFDAEANLIDAYPILDSQSNNNCAGGPSPWGTWLSCEEIGRGRVWECDPFGTSPFDGKNARALPALGLFKHEAVAFDRDLAQVYLTEDESDGRFYRFTPDRLTSEGYPVLDSGTLEVAQVQGEGLTGSVRWHVIEDLNGRPVTTRNQVPESTPFDGGEGIWWHEGVVYFSTKGDNRIWAYDTIAAEMDVIYDAGEFNDPDLVGVDNVVVSPFGDVLVAEDIAVAEKGGRLEIVAITPERVPVPVVAVVGHDYSELAGPAFDPSGQRLYFSSQRGVNSESGNGSSGIGITDEITGPFLEPRTNVA